MNRTIKFRGKRLNNQEWVYGSLVQYGPPKNLADIYDPETSQYITVDPDTVGQFTGLTDKNDVEIWENDLIRELINGTILMIGWIENSYNFTSPHYDLSNYITNDLEVIGNTTDNPELAGSQPLDDSELREKARKICWGIVQHESLKPDKDGIAHPIRAVEQAIDQIMHLFTQSSNSAEGSDCE